MSDPDELKTVDLSLSPDELREFCEQNDRWVLELPPEWTSADVEALYARQLTGQRPYLGLISEIAADPRAAGLLSDIWARFGDAIEVASALATNPAIPKTLRDKMLVHRDETVREHARYNAATTFARLTWFLEQDGGRASPPTERSYSTVARFGVLADKWPQEAWSVVLSIRGPADSGGVMVAEIRMLAGNEAPPELLASGRRFELFEGSRRVAIGKIL